MPFGGAAGEPDLGLVAGLRQQSYLMPMPLAALVRHGTAFRYRVGPFEHWVKSASMDRVTAGRPSALPRFVWSRPPCWEQDRSGGEREGEE